MTVTITGPVEDVTGVADNTSWQFASVLRFTEDGTLVTAKPKTVYPVAGILTVKLTPGPTIVTYGKQAWNVTVPETDGTLKELIEDGIAFPPQTAQEALDAAVAQSVINNSAQFRTRAVPVAPEDPNTLYQWLDANDNPVGDPVPFAEIVNVGWDRIYQKPSVIGAGPTAGAARLAIGAISTTQAETLVVAKLAEDGTPAAAAAVAAETAVDDYVSGELDLVQGTTDVGDDDIHWGIRDSAGRKQVAAHADGTVDLPLPKLAGAQLQAVESPQGYLHGTRDSDGRVAEDVYYSDGTKPLWVLQRWGERAGWGEHTPYRDWIVVGAGQSNMAGVGDVDPPEGLYDTDPRVVKYDRVSDALVPLGVTEGGLYATLGRAAAENAPADVRIVVIPAAAGDIGFRSSSIEPTPVGYEAKANGTWDRTLTADPLNRYVMMLEDIAAALALSPDAQLKALFWSQGESDQDMLDQTEYAAALDDMISAFRTAVDDSAVPVVIGSLVPEYANSDADKTAIQNALIDTPRRVLNSAFVYGPENMMRSDQVSSIHFATAGMLDRARMMVRAVERARWNFSASKAIPPQNLRLIRSGAVLTAKWDAPPTRHTLFTVEYQVNGGSWSAMTKPAGDIGLSATATIAASDVVQVRASTTNDTNTSPYAYASA